AGDAGEDGGLHYGQRDGGQDERLQRDRSLAPAGKSSGREPAERDREQQDQQDREPEVRNGNAELGSGHDAIIADGVVPGGGEDAEREREDGGQRHRDQRQRQRQN